MPQSKTNRWLPACLRRPGRAPHRRPALAVQALEARDVPATHVFLMGSGNWNDDANWDIGKPVPDGNNPVNVVFTEGQTVTVDAVAPGLVVNSISFVQSAAVTLNLNVDVKLSPAAGELFALNVETAGNRINGPGRLVLGDGQPGTQVGLSVAAGKTFILGAGLAGAGDLFIDTAGDVNLAGPRTGTGQTILANGSATLFAGAVGGSYVVGSGPGGTGFLTIANSDAVSVDRVTVLEGSAVGLAQQSLFTVDELVLGTAAGGAKVQGAGTLRVNQSVTANGAGKLSQITCNTVFAPPFEADVTTTGDLTISGAVTADDGILKGGGGTLRLTAPAGNQITSTVTVRDGVLDLATPAGKAAVGGDLVVGDVLDVDPVIRLGNNNVIADGNEVRVGVRGTFDVNGKTETVGRVRVNGGGTLAVGAGKLTTGDLFLTGAPANMTDAGALTVTTQIAALADGNSKASAVTGGTLTFAGGTRMVDVAPGATLTVTSKLLDGKMLKFGAGTLSLAGVSVFPFAVDVNAGTLSVPGVYPAMPVALKGGTLTGGGLVGVTTATGGTFAPGAPGGPMNPLTAANLSLDAATTAAMTVVTVGQNSQVQVTGTVALGGAELKLTEVLSVPLGTQFKLVDNDAADPVTGAFAGLPEGAVIATGQNTFRIRYAGGDGNDVTLTAVATAELSLVATPADGVVEGDTVTLRATVSAESSSPGGVVNFFAGDVLIGTEFIGDGGVAELVVPAGFAPAGVNTYSVVYPGDDTHVGANAKAVEVTVTANTAPTVADITNQSVQTSGTTGALAFTVGDGQTAADALAVTVTSSNPGLVPAAGLVLGGSGAGRTLTVTPTAGVTGTTTVTVTVTDAQGLSTVETFDVVVSDVPPVIPPVVPPVIPPVVPPVVPPATPKNTLVGPFAVGAGAGGQVRVFNADRTERPAVTLPAGFGGGVRTAVADFSGDGVADTAVAAGPGQAPRVMVFDGKTGATLFDALGFEETFTGGVYLTAGDITGDGKADLVVTPDEGGGPRVRVFSGGANFGLVADYFGIDDPNFRGGARAAVGDVTGDGVADLTVAAGFGGGPRMTIWDGATVRAGSPQAVSNFFAFEEGLRNGAYVTAGDVTGDGVADLAFGGGPGGGPRVRVFDGKVLVNSGSFGSVDDIGGQVANFFGGDEANRGGVRLAMKDLDGDARADLVLGAGAGAGSRVTGYLGATLAGGGAAAFELDAFPGLTSGVFVG